MLTPKQKAYAQARADGAKQTHAAIAAGYSEKTATQAASRLEKDHEVFAHIQRLKGLPSAPLKEVTKKTIKRLVKFAKKPVQIAAPPAPVIEPVSEPVRERMIDIGTLDPLELMKQLVSDVSEDPKLRLAAAVALAPYMHSKQAELGKKEQQAQTAQSAATGKFAASAPPRLVARNG
jgi:phage terminase small subunit